MNEKQAKRLRRAAKDDRKSMRSARAGQSTGTLVEQLHMLWPLLNHRQRGAVSAHTKGRYTFQWRARLHLEPTTIRVPSNLPRAASKAIRYVVG